MCVLPHGMVTPLHGKLYIAIHIGHIFYSDKERIPVTLPYSNTISIANNDMGDLRCYSRT